MLLLIDNWAITEPRINLAMEEVALRQLPPENDYVLVYRNQATVVVGRHQNVWEEVNLPYLRQHHISLVRRISGGGTVYHDIGNLNITFITTYTRQRFNNYREFTRPILETLHHLGVQAKLNERNDLVIGQFKISGNAQFTSRNRLMSHGTLLFHSDLQRVRESLQAETTGIESRARKSVRSPVTNIVHYLPRSLRIDEFRTLLLQRIFGNTGEFPTYSLSETHWAQIVHLSQNKYGSWEWNMAESPPFTLRRTFILDNRPIQVVMSVERGRIQELNFSGNSEKVKLLQPIKARIIGKRLEFGEIRKALLREPKELAKKLQEVLPI